MRILSKSLKLFLVVLAFGATALYAEEAVSALQSLLNAETNFAEMAAEKGTRDAFLANLSDEAVIFDPGPVNGKKVWLKRESSESKLIWQPIFADVARAGDLGYTTGPWEFKKNASDAKASGYGQFLTVWKKQADGAWKVVLDGGIETPAPTGKPAAAQTPEAEPASSTKRDLKSARRALANAEEQFSDASGKDAGAALISAASDGIRVFRAGRFPAVGKDAAQLMLSYDHGKMTATRLGKGVSRSGDLAYSYGEYSTERLDGVERGSFVTIWKMNAAGEWKLVVDVRKSRPPAEKKAKE
jgi:ketosteroid isomerase-like protein